MEPQVDKIGGDSLHGWKMRGVGDAQGESGMFKETNNFGDEPAIMPKLKGLPCFAQEWRLGEKFAESGKEFFLIGKLGGKLPENDFKFLSKSVTMFPKALNRIFTVSKPFDVGNVSASLNGKDEPLWCPVVPALKHLFLHQPVKGDIELYRVKVTAIVFEPPTLRDTLGVKDPFTPVRVIITACSDAKCSH